jgi:uncharacterized protein YqeY
MSLKDVLQADLKTSMIARDSFTTDVIKSLKSAILYAEVAANKRDQGLGEDEILAVFKKESKKRQESADLYTKGSRPELAQKELAEKKVIDAYLPAQLDEQTLNGMVDDAMAEMSLQALTRQDMGKIIGAVKQKGGAQVDASVLARLINGRIAA